MKIRSLFLMITIFLISTTEVVPSQGRIGNSRRSPAGRTLSNQEIDKQITAINKQIDEILARKDAYSDANRAKEGALDRKREELLALRRKNMSPKEREIRDKLNDLRAYIVDERDEKKIKEVDRLSDELKKFNPWDAEQIRGELHDHFKAD